MAVIRCARCGAVVRAQQNGDDVEASYGADFRQRCRSLKDRMGADFISTVSECPDMDSALRAAEFRLRATAMQVGAATV